MTTTTCSRCGSLYEETSEERAEELGNLCHSCFSRDVVLYINRTPSLLSLLYDIGLLPEQIRDEHSWDWQRMLLIALYWKDEFDKKSEQQSNEERDEPKA